jgi:hypothetical protein
VKRPVSPPLYVATVQLAGHGCFTSVGMTAAEARGELRRGLDKYAAAPPQSNWAGANPAWTEQAMESADVLAVPYLRCLHWEPGEAADAVVVGEEPTRKVGR